MVAGDLIVTVLFMLVFVGPLLGVTWHSIRSDHHSPLLLRELERELEEKL